MPNIIFYLNTGAIGKEDKVPLMAKVIHKGKRHYKTIGRIKESDWNLSKKRVAKNHKNSPYNRHKEINATLNQLEQLMNSFNDYCLLNQYPVTEDSIKQILKGIDPVSGKKSANRPEISLSQAFDEFVAYSKENKEYNTYKRRNTVFGFIKEFQEDTNHIATFRNIDMILFDRLKQYAIQEKKYSNNTFAQTIKVFKTFLGWCKSRDYFSGEIPKDFSASEKDITPIVLTVEEFKTLYDFEFEKEKYRKVRDIFCFGCLTGLRFSDLQRLQREWISDNHIQITLQKVKEPVKIKLVERSLKIIERYQEQPIFVLPQMSNQKFNDFIKEACALAELKSPVTIDTYKGNQFTQETFEKHEVITAHVARKTFITLSFYLGMNIEYVKKITGINQEKTLRKYLKIAEDMADSQMDNTWGKL